ncbi:hypothetical protein ACROYT_G024846 [Oculina patagonica]
MKGLILVALVGFVFAIGLALPFTDDEAEAYEAELKQIGNDIFQSNPKLDDGDKDLDEDEIDSDGHDDAENDDDEDADDEDENSLSDPLDKELVEKSSDPILPFLIFRGARRLARRFRRRRSRRGRRFRRFFRRRRRSRG